MIVRGCLPVCLGEWKCVCVRACVHAGGRSCVRVRSLFHSVRFQQLLCCAHKRIVNIIKVYIERSNMQVEIIRFRKNIAFIHVYFCEARNSTRPACLRLESRYKYNINLFNSNHFNFP